MYVWVYFSNVLRFAGLRPVGWHNCRIPAPGTGNSTAARAGWSYPVFAYSIWQHSSGRLEIETRTTCPSVNHAFRGVCNECVVPLTLYEFLIVDASAPLNIFLCGNRSLPTSRPHDRDSSNRSRRRRPADKIRKEHVELLQVSTAVGRRSYSMFNFKPYKRW